MGLAGSLLVIALLIACSAFFSVAEISVAAARRVRLLRMAEAGDARALRVSDVQRQPGDYFTVVQIGQNVVAILGGVVGEGALSPHVEPLLRDWAGPQGAETVAFLVSFLVVTSLFILFSDLLPKRLGMVAPERLAVRVVGPMHGVMKLLRPAVWVFGGLADALFRLSHLPIQRDEQITPDDIVALAVAGAEAGVLHEQEQQVIENVLELDRRTVESAMTPRQRIIFFLQDESEQDIRARIAADPHSTYVVCAAHIDQVVGTVDAADLFARMLRKEPIALHGEVAKGLLQKPLVVPDRITLWEVLTQFRQAHEDFAVIVNEYSLVVGIITLNDVMSTVMGSLVSPGEEPQIVGREDGSWLMEGLTPIVDVLRVIGADMSALPQRGEYDTLAGFLMVMLRRIPRRTDCVDWNGYRFEVIDVDSGRRIDQVLVKQVSPARHERFETAA